MKRYSFIFTVCALSAAVGSFSTAVIAQKPVVLIVKQSKIAGDTVWTDIVADNFKNIVSFRFTLAEDQQLTRFLALENPEPLLDLSPANFSGLNPNTSFRINWTYPNVNGLSLAPGARLFTIKWLKTAAHDVCIGFSHLGPIDLEIQYSRMQPNTTLTFSSCEKIILTHFNVFYDRNNDCKYDAGETLLDEYEVSDLFNNQNTYHRNLYALRQGSEIFGNHQFAVLAPNALWAVCQNNRAVNIDSQTQLVALDFPLQAVKSCPEMEIEISAPEVRRCADYSYRVVYRNRGTQKASPVNISLELDPFTRFVEASLSPTHAAHPFVFFQIPEVGPLEKGEFTVKVHTDCNSTVWGQTHCLKGTIFPNAHCETSPQWDGSSVRVSGKCENGIVKFQIANGVNEMTSPSQYWIVEEDLMPGLKKDIQLKPNDIINLEWPGDGKTYRLFVSQSAHHPGRSYPTAAIEGCGRNAQGGFSRGFVTQFSEDEEDDFVAIDCQASAELPVGNLLYALPSGVLAPHFVEPGRTIQYTIRFQNEGNDSAYRVVIRDTLNPVFDLSTLVLSNSSHPFTYGVENRVLTIRFDPIRLPFKRSSEIHSRGFVTFSLRLHDDIAPNTRFENRAYVYFNQRPAVVTPAVFHTVKRDFLINTVFIPKHETIRIYPNPSNGSYTVSCDHCLGSERLYLFDIHGKLWHTQLLNDKEEKISLENVFKPGLYYQIIKRGENLCYYGSITILP